MSPEQKVPNFLIEEITKLHISRRFRRGNSGGSTINLSFGVLDTRDYRAAKLGGAEETR
jgi:hypothetical protein